MKKFFMGIVLAMVLMVAGGQEASATDVWGAHVANADIYIIDDSVVQKRDGTIRFTAKFVYSTQWEYKQVAMWHKQNSVDMSLDHYNHNYSLETETGQQVSQLFYTALKFAKKPTYNN
ncbi:hypothetical protein [uncultured Veillonella sp.]|uniref:hypothetical protein n=1 Tax=uncultured Veillonella sp. TaxID=159268 RepID=UPI002631AF4D|nr:hypothetical protein [uncultured Veillonella sp.]